MIDYGKQFSSGFRTAWWIFILNVTWLEGCLLDMLTPGPFRTAWCIFILNVTWLEVCLLDMLTPGPFRTAWCIFILNVTWLEGCLLDMLTPGPSRFSVAIKSYLEMFVGWHINIKLEMFAND